MLLGALPEIPSNFREAADKAVEISIRAPLLLVDIDLGESGFGREHRPLSVSPRHPLRDFHQLLTWTLSYP